MKVGVVGAGLVGSTAAYAMVMSGVGREIVMVDANPERVAGETAAMTRIYPSNMRLRRAAGHPARTAPPPRPGKPGSPRCRIRLQENLTFQRSTTPL